ncbi:NAD(P)H-hydrate dehydratase [Arthrobacter deserti]|uniref:ADP-dependent (S)-NAD(P)H-hydrate dehydratase n=1 Tax=Arthrobacter deserti TaxID=1742687 RepID=A0ABX1JJ49_9MICC|nr:NAD(P)H-hydrate dehydratase [Arthrobacter deserti]
MSTPSEPVTPAMLRSWPLRSDAEGKDDRGTVLVVGGSRRTPGAAMLTGLAALRAGAGRLTLAVAESAAVGAAIAVPESGVVGLPENPRGSVRGDAAPVLEEDLGAADVVVVGPGLDDADETAALLAGLAPSIGNGAAVVLDAYALGGLVDLEQVYRQGARRLVLPPNPAEAARLPEPDGVDMADAVPRIAERYQAVVTGQGIIADPEGKVWEVAAGNAGLGTSGSGDVLAGAVGGLLARKASPAQAACWGTYLHATAGDHLASAIGPLSFLARELHDAVPQVLAELGT